MKNLRQPIKRPNSHTREFGLTKRQEYINEYRSTLISDKNGYYWRYLFDIDGKLMKEFIS